MREGGPPALLFLLSVLCVIAPSSSWGAGSPSPFDECEAKVRAQPEAPYAYFCYVQIASRTGRWRDGAGHLEKILAGQPENTYALVSLAQLEASQGWEEAGEHFRTALDLYAARGEKAPAGEVVFTSLQYASFLKVRGRIDEAREQTRLAAEAAERSGQALLLASVLVDRAWLAYMEADHGAAELHLKRAEEPIFKEGDPFLRAKWLSTIGTVRWATSRLDDALRYFRDQADLMHEAGALHQEATALWNVALVMADQHRDESSERRREDLAETLRDVLRAAIEGGNKQVQAKIHLELASVVRSTEEIRRHTRRSLELAREFGDPDIILHALGALAGSFVRDAPRDEEKGFRLLREMEERAASLGDPASIARAASYRATNEWWIAREEDHGPEARKRAINSSLAALDAIEAIRDRQADGMVRARTLTSWTLVYDQLIGNLLWSPEGSSRSPDLDLAFRIMERKAARVLLDDLDAARAGAGFAPEGAAAEERVRLLKRLTEIQREMMGSSLSDEARADLLADLDRLEIEEVALRAEIARSDPAFAALRQPEHASAGLVRTQLAADEALLAFHVARQKETYGSFTGGSWLLVITREDTRAHRIPEKPVIDEAVEFLSGLVQGRDGSEAPGAARLYRDLLEKPLKDLPRGIERLIIVPSGSLHRLPLGLLRPAPEAVPLAKRFRISRAPSATIWVRWRQSQIDPAEAPAMALADPDLSFLRDGGADGAMDTARPHGTSLTRGIQLGQLPEARREARALVRLLGGESRLLEGTEATERSLKEGNLSRFALLHLGAHALVDAGRPHRSAVLLTPGAPNEDGLLQMREIVELELPGRAVVLAACRSASGEVLEGEGVMSLARAFFVAGAHAVVGSLWPLRDDEAAALFGEFYRQLGEGQSLGGALAAAKEDRIRAGAPAAAWAGLILLGNGDLVPLPGGRPAGLLPWAAGIAVVALLAAALLALRAFHARRSLPAS